MVYVARSRTDDSKWLVSPGILRGTRAAGESGSERREYFSRVLSMAGGRDKRNLVKWGKKTTAKKLESLQQMDPIYHSLKGDEIDAESAFQVYAQLTGDVEKAAHALGISPAQVIEMASSLGWQERLKTIFELKKSNKPGDVEKAINRAVNFVQAHRYRIVLERITNRLYAMSADELVGEITTVSYDKDGNEVKRVINTRILADLATALEKVQQLTYAALVDTSSDRSKRKAESDDQSDVSLQSIHSVISQAMSDTQNSVRREEFSQRLKQAQSQTPTGVNPPA